MTRHGRHCRAKLDDEGVRMDLGEKTDLGVKMDLGDVEARQSAWDCLVSYARTLHRRRRG